MYMMRSKIAAGLLFQSRLEGMFHLPDAWRQLPDVPGTHPVILGTVGAGGFRNRLYSSWSSVLTPFSVMMEVLYDSLA